MKQTWKNNDLLFINAVSYITSGLQINLLKRQAYPLPHDHHGWPLPRQLVRPGHQLQCSAQSAVAATIPTV